MTHPAALERFRVVDLTRVRAGPTAVRQLADWGAQVVKVETPSAEGDMGGPRQGPDFQNLHRNKRSLTLNLKEPRGRDILLRLVGKADVLVENYRPDVKARLGIDYETLRAVNPRLVYASISGFGQDGPYSKRPGFDQIAQGMGGLMSITGLPGGGPMRVGIPIADLGAGLYCALGILTALLEREVSGEGQWVQSSLLTAQIALLDFQAARWLAAGEVPQQAGNDHPTSIPTGVFPTADGNINIACAGEMIWRRLCDTLGLEALPDDERFSNGAARSAHRVELNALIGEVTQQQTSSHWVEALNAAGVPCGPINAIDEVFADPQVQHLGMAQEVEEPAEGPKRLVGQPVRLSRTPSRLRSASPQKGQHTGEILGELGLDEGEVADLRRDGIV